MYRNLILAIPILIAFLVTVHIFFPDVYAINPTTIQLNSPQEGQIISGSSVSFGGNFTDDHTNTPSIYLSVDDSSSQPVILNGNSWNLGLTLASGWHKATVILKDGKDQRTAGVNFLVNNGAFQPTKYNLILIEYSQACTNILKNNITSICPSLDKLVPFDTTKGILGSGHFIKDKKGITYRTKPEIKNYWLFFDKLSFKPVCVDCMFDFAKVGTMQLIFIEPSNFAYITPIETPTNSNYTTLSNNTITINQVGEKTTTVNYNRSITSDCTTANIFFTPIRLSDTINYMTNGCKGNVINNTSTIPIIIPIVDPTKSQSWKNQTWLKEAKIINKGDCITHSCPSIRDPNSKWK